MRDQDTYTLREAAKRCDLPLTALRKRADRGSLQTTRRDDGQRLVTHAELRRVGLLDGSEIVRLRRDVARLQQELAAHRQLAAGAQAEAAAERDGHARVTAALVEQRAIATTAQARAAELEQLERDLAAAGPIRAWRIARQRSKSPHVT
jgi:DNA-binding transcriptional MerR regulator